MKKALVLVLVGLMAFLGACSGEKPGPGPAAHASSAPDYYQGALSWDNVEFILHSASIGRLITNDDDNPYSVPISFGYCQRKVYFHSTTLGRKMRNIEAESRVCFVVDRYNEREGWASVTILGTAHIVSEPEAKILALQRFAAAYKNPADEIEKLAAAIKPKPLPPMDLTMVEITPDKVYASLRPVNRELMPRLPYMTEDNMPEPSGRPLSGEESKIFGKHLPADLVKWLLESGAVGRLNVFTGSYPDSGLAEYSCSGNRIRIKLEKGDPGIAHIVKDARVSFSLDRVTSDVSGWKAELPALGGIKHSLELPDTAGLLLWLSVNVFGRARIIDSSPGAPEVMVEITPDLITSKASHLAMKQPKMIYTFKDRLLKPE